jgi:hypothetical protein
MVWCGQALYHQEASLQSGMYLVDTFYNFCTFHDSLRQEPPTGRHKWAERTPAMAAGITDHCWRPAELMTFKLAPTPWVLPKRRGRKPKQAEERAMASV